MFGHSRKNTDTAAQANMNVSHNYNHKLQENMNANDNDSLIEMIAKKDIKHISPNGLIKNEKVISNLELVQDFGKTKQKCFGRNKSLNSIDIDINDINFLFDKKLSNAEKISL